MSAEVASRCRRATMILGDRCARRIEIGAVLEHVVTDVGRCGTKKNEVKTKITSRLTSSGVVDEVRGPRQRVS